MPAVVNGFGDKPNRGGGQGYEDEDYNQAYRDIVVRRVAQQRLQTQEQLGRELTDLERQNQEARTAAMAEGLDKQLQQIRDAYSRRSAEVDLLEAQWTQKSREAGLEGLTPEQTDALAEARRAALQEMNQAADQARREDAERQQDEQDRQRQAWNEYLIEYGNVQEKRQAIAQKYAILIRRAETEGEKATLTRQMQDELDEFDNKVKGSTTLMAQLFADTARRSTSELDRLVDKAELLMRYLAATKDAQGTARIDGRTVTRGDILSLGVSEHTLGRLQQSAEETEALAGAIRKLRGELGSRSPFLALRTQIEDATAQMKSGDLSGGIEQMASAVEQFMPAVEQMGRELGYLVLGLDDVLEGAAEVGVERGPQAGHVLAHGFELGGRGAEERTGGVDAALGELVAVHEARGVDVAGQLVGCLPYPLVLPVANGVRPGRGARRVSDSGQLAGGFLLLPE